MPQIHFKISLEEANLVFKGLGYLPFKDVYELIGKLNDQANNQLQKTNSFSDNLEELPENKNHTKQNK